MAERRRPHFGSLADLELLNDVNTPIWIFDVDRHAMWWANTAGLAFWHAPSLDELLHRDFSGDSEAVRLRLRQLVDTDGASPGIIEEIWTLYPREEPTTVAVDMRPVTVDDGHDALLIEARPIHELREDPEALRIIEAARSSRMLVSTFSLHGELISQNPAAYATYATTTRRGPGLNERFVEPDDAQRIVAAITARISFEAELAVNTATGQRIHQVVATRGRDPVTGEYVIILNEEDLTENARLRQDLENLNRQLESRVADRTRELEMVGRLAGGVAHDFNNLLGVISLSVEMLEDGPDPAAAANVDHAVRRASELTQQLLSFSRRQRLEPRRIDAEPFLRRARSAIEGIINGDTTVVSGNVAQGLGMDADPDQLELALLNLARDAKDAMPSGGKISLSIETASQEEIRELDSVKDDARYICISIADTGEGMDEQTRQSAFEPFFTTRGVGRGSGLGLSMVYGFARQSGGTLSLESSPGQGTTVRLYLPQSAPGR